MNSKYVVLSMLAAVPCLAFAEDSEFLRCAFGDLQRRVEILHEPGISVPCEVHYYKDTEAPGERQVLWSAFSDAGYCERKVQEFVARLESWGWDCKPGDDSMRGVAPEVATEAESESATETETAAESATVDDTEALTPADATDDGEEE